MCSHTSDRVLHCREEEENERGQATRHRGFSKTGSAPMLIRQIELKTTKQITTRVLYLTVHIIKLFAYCLRLLLFWFFHLVFFFGFTEKNTVARKSKNKMRLKRPSTRLTLCISANAQNHCIILSRSTKSNRGQTWSRVHETRRGVCCAQQILTPVISKSLL